MCEVAPGALEVQLEVPQVREVQAVHGVPQAGEVELRQRDGGHERNRERAVRFI